MRKTIAKLDQLSSKMINEASSSSDLTLVSVTVDTKLTSVGKTFLADTNIAGKLTVGTMTFDDLEDSVNTIGTLKFQDSPLAGAIELFGGTIKLARDGTIETQGAIIAKKLQTEELTISVPASQGETLQEATVSAALAIEPLNRSIGEGTIKAGQTSVVIETNKVKTSSKIFVTAQILSKRLLLYQQKLTANRLKWKWQPPKSKTSTLTGGL